MKNYILSFCLMFVAASIASRAAEEQKTPAQPTETTVPSAAKAHLLQPMDKLSFVVEEDPAPVKNNERRSIDLAVSAAGQLEAPVSRCCETVVTIDAKGKTIAQAEEEIRAKLLADYYKKATVQLRLVDSTRKVGQVWLRGAVKGNVFTLDPAKPATLWEVLTAVGVSEFANLKKVQVDRKGQIKYINIDAVNSGKRGEDMELQDGDRILVKEKWLNF